MRSLNRLILAGIAVLSPALVQAADAAAGKAKAALCSACHGPEGISIAPIYPNLAGQKAAYLEASMKAYRDGQRQNPIMAPMAKPLSDADITNLAAYFSNLKP